MSVEKEKRIKELKEFIGNDKFFYLKNLINDIVFMEEQLENLKKLPFIKYDKNNLEKQKKTEASKLYLSILAQYTQDIKTLSFLSGKTESEDAISPLRLYIEKINKGEIKENE